MNPTSLTPRQIKLLWMALALLALTVWFRTAWVCDDAFISLRTVDNALHGYGLRWNIAERVQSYTHPLWLLCLVPIYGLIGDPYYAVLAAGLLASVAAVWLLGRQIAASQSAAAVAVTLLLVSRGFVDYSSSGLENPLTHLLLAAFSFSMWQASGTGSSPLMPSLCAALLLMNRLDLLVLIAPALGWLWLRQRSWRPWRAVLLGLAPLLFWLGFALVYYGTCVPNTALAKLQSGVPARELWSQGLRYLAYSLHYDPATLLTIGATAALVAWRGRTIERALMLGVGAQLLYIVSVGGDFMAGRFLTAPFFLAILCMARLFDLADRWPRRVAWLALVLVGIITPRAATLIDRSGIADERRYYWGSTGLLNGTPDWARPTTEARLPGDIARAIHTPLLVENAVGVIGFYAGPTVTVVDRAALCDPLLARLPMVAADPLAIDLMRRVSSAEPLHSWRIGHFTRNLPRGYLSSLLTGQNKIVDLRAAALYADVSTITRAPLWSPARRAAIFRQRWTLQSPIAMTRLPFESPDWNEVLALRPDDAQALFRRAARSDNPGPDLERAVALAPQHALAWMDLGSWRQRNGDTSGALAAWRRASEAAPRWAAPWIATGVAQAKAGQLEQAIVSLQRAQSVDPRNIGTYAPLGLALMQSGQKDRARQVLQRGSAWDDESSRRLLAALAQAGSPADP